MVVPDNEKSVDPNVDFIVVPDGLSLIQGDVVLDEELINKEGGGFLYMAI